MNAVDVVNNDIRNPFDSVSHSIILNKLFLILIHSVSLAWMQSYLCDGKPFVRSSGLVSHPICITSGVTQGSHLGKINNADTYLRNRGHKTNYGSSEPSLNMSSFLNEVCYLFDFAQPRLSFRHNIRRIWLLDIDKGTE